MTLNISFFAYFSLFLSSCTTCLDKRLIPRRGEVRAGAGGGQAGGCFDHHDGGDEGDGDGCGGCEDGDGDM